MKKLITLIAFTLFILTGQTQAQWQKIGPTGNVKILGKTSKYLIASNFYLLRSSDDGLTWENMEYEGKRIIENQFVKFGDTLISLPSNSLDKYYSYDGGKTWNMDYLPIKLSLLKCLAIGKSIYCISNGEKIYKSDDTTKTWNTIETNLPKGYYENVYLVDNIVYLTSGYNMSYSKDSCKTWSPIPKFNYDNYYLFAGDQFIDEEIADTAFAKEFYVSTDVGKTWQSYDPRGIVKYNIQSVYFEKGSIRIRTDEGVFSTTNNGKDWYKYTTSFMPAKENNRITLNNWELCATSGGFYKKDNGDSLWSFIPTNCPHLSEYSLTSSNNILFLTTNYEGLYKSSDYGKTWLNANNGIISTETNTIVATKSYLYATNMGHHNYSYNLNSIHVLYKGDLNGENWKSCPNAPKNQYYTKIVSYDNIDYICTEAGIFSSKDSGDTWNEYNSIFKNQKINDLTVNDSIVVVTTSNEMYKSENYGKTFIPIKSSDELKNAYFIKYIDGAYYAGTYYGIFKCVDNLKTWKLVNSDIQAKEMIKYKNYLLCSKYDFAYSKDNGETWQLLGQTPTLHSMIYLNDALYALQYEGFEADGVLKYDIPTSFSKTALISPYNTAIEIKQDTILNWSELDNALNYEVQIALDLDFNNSILNLEHHLNYYHITSLTPNTKYYWRVRAIFGDIKGEWSDTWSFTTAKSNAVNDEKNDLIYIYPNPANNRIVISALSLLNSDVKVGIYNSLGALLVPVAFNSQSGESTEQSIDVSHLPSGIYRVVIEAQGKTISKALSIVK